MFYAYCWQDGLIEYGNKIPEGALEIARGSKKIKDIIERHATDNGRFITSVRMAYLGITQDDPVECLIKFSRYINKILGKK